MRRFPVLFFILCLGSLLPLAGAQLPAGSRSEMRLTADREPLSYAPGGRMVFTVTLTVTPAPAEPLFISWRRSGDDGGFEAAQVRYNGKPLTIVTSLAVPGFVRIYAEAVDAAGKPVKDAAGKTIFVDGGAGVEPGKLRGTPEPADFDRFWQGQLRKLAQVPLQAEQKPVHSTKKVHVYRVSVSCAGKRPCTGYLRVPVDAKPQSLPVEVAFDGYGYYGGVFRAPADGRTDRIVFNVNAHGYELERDAAYYRQFARETFQGKRYAYVREENRNPETAYFCDMSLRALRALEFVRTLPQWNGRDLIVTGGSQGGLQAVWCAAFDRKVSAAEIHIPWCCDVSGHALSRRLPGGRPDYEPGLDYYDAANCAKRITCPVTITRAGLGDYVCPPSGLAIFYQALKCPKEIRWYQNSEHNYIPDNPEIFVYTGTLPGGEK